MSATIALGLVGGLLASKLFFRARFRRHRQRYFQRRWHRDAPPAATPAIETPRRLDALLATLELNQRQAEEAREAFADVAQALGFAWRSWSGLERALLAVAAERFDAAQAQAALGALEEQPARAALDALEHFHNILTPEQRDKLARNAYSSNQLEA